MKIYKIRTEGLHDYILNCIWIFIFSVLIMGYLFLGALTLFNWNNNLYLFLFVLILFNGILVGVFWYLFKTLKCRHKVRIIIEPQGGKRKSKR